MKYEKRVLQGAEEAENVLAEIDERTTNYTRAQIVETLAKIDATRAIWVALLAKCDELGV